MRYEYRPLYIYCDSGTGEINGTFPKSIRKSPFLLGCTILHGRAGVIPLIGEMSAKQTKGCPNSENFAPAAGLL